MEALVRAHADLLPRPRLLALDIDGTILDPAGLLRPRVRDAIRAVAETGVEIVLATGRSPWWGVEEIAGALGLDGPHITMQGAMLSIPSTGEILRLRALPPAVYRDALRFAHEIGADPVVALADGHRGERLPDDVDFVHARWFAPEQDLGRLIDQRPVRVFLPTPRDRHHAVRVEAQRRFAGRGSVVWGDLSGVEILAPGTNKGEAIGWYAGTRGLSLADVAAVGDAMNDLELLGAAGRSAAMGQASPEVRACADIVAGPCALDGVLDAFAWFFPDLAERMTDLASRT